MIVSAPPEIPTPYRRSAFQVALLFFATGGIYIFVWAFYVRRWCAGTLERPDQPLWKSIALIIPIFNLFLLFDLGQLIKGVAWRANLPRTALPLPWLGIVAVVIGALWRLPDPYWLLCLFDFVPFALLQLVFVRSEIAVAGTAATPTKFHWIEWIVIVLGSVLWALAAVTTLLPDANGVAPPLPWFGPAVFAAVVVVLFIIRRSTASSMLAADRM